jgi:hypothetical protein
MSTHSMRQKCQICQKNKILQKNKKVRKRRGVMAHKNKMSRLATPHFDRAVTGPEETRHCLDGLKKIQTFFSRNGDSLAGKLFPPPVGVFCTHLEPPKCLIMQKSDFSGFYHFLDFPGFGILGLLRKKSLKVGPSSGEGWRR